MRTLLLLRGIPGSGKSTWIENSGLKKYTLSADDIRLLCSSPIMATNGAEELCVSNDYFTWKMLFQLLENRMKQGAFTVIDATNSKTYEMNQYKKLCNTYKYKLYCVDFTDIPFEECNRRNLSREQIKVVPYDSMLKMYSRVTTQKVPSGITVIKPDELYKIFMKPIDLSSYKKIHHIGDIHGCNTVLQKYLSGQGGLKDDEMYIFIGDYIGRGIENADIVKFLISIKDKPNVLLLEGNHERLLWIYANDCITQSKEFESVVKPELISSGISKKDIRQLYRKFAQCAYYEYCDDTYIVTHAGLSTLPDNLTFIPTSQMNKGVGSYNDFEKVADNFIKSTDNYIYQIYGHRNPKGLPIQMNDRVFNLDGHVEYGGNLRCLQISKDGFLTFEIKNDVFREQDGTLTLNDNENTECSMSKTIKMLRSNEHIIEKNFGNFSSFNFDRSAFSKRIWNEQTIKSRGLYIDVNKEKVVARAYDKFFNINEMPETQLNMLQYKLKFPVDIYVKENGFLGIVSYDEYNDDLLIATKSRLDGDHAQWLKRMLYASIPDGRIEEMKNFIKKNNVSFVFECIDMVNDPHIIDYVCNRLVLLDIIDNDMKFSKYSYKETKNIAMYYGFFPKEKAYEIATWQNFFDWYYAVLDKEYTYNGSFIEGFVIEDRDGYMVKLKLAYYNFWKFMRSIAHETIKYGYSTRTSALTSATANNFYNFMKKLHDTQNPEDIPKDICSLRNLYYNQNKTIAFDRMFTGGRKRY